MDFIHYKFSQNEQRQVLSNITILIDSREKENSHITDWLDLKKMPYIKQKLDFGDYSFKLTSMPEIGINRDIYFERDMVIERKNSLEELSHNLAQERHRFENEWLRAGNCRKLLIIERGNYEDIITGSYGTNLKPASYFGSLISFQHRYGLNISFVGKEYMGQFIYCQFYYYLKELMG